LIGNFVRIRFSLFYKFFSFFLVCYPLFFFSLYLSAVLGKTYVFGGDHTAYQASRALIPMELFNKSGFLFQKFLLNPMAGYSESFRATANTETRKSIITAIEKLFRLPNSAGKVRWIFRKVNKISNSNTGKTQDSVVNDIFSTPQKASKTIRGERDGEGEDKERSSSAAYRKFPMVVDLSESSMALLQAVFPHPSPSAPSVSLLNSKTRPELRIVKKATSAVKKPNEGKTTSKRAKKTGKNQRKGKAGKKTQHEHEDSEAKTEEDIGLTTIKWVTSDHASLGRKVASYFQAGRRGQRKLFFGEITKFAPPSINFDEGGNEKNDQLYHVSWEDGDEEDYDQQQYEEGLSLYEGEATWTNEDHESVGKNVAAYFNTSSNSKSLELTLFCGTITKYSPAVCAGDTETRNRSDGQRSPSSRRLLRNERFHVVWEDDDEEDYTKEQYEAGARLFTKLENEEENENQRLRSEGSLLKDHTITSSPFYSPYSLLPPALSTRAASHPSISSKKAIRYNYDDDAEEAGDKKSRDERGEGGIDEVTAVDGKPKKSKRTPPKKKNQNDVKALEEKGWIFDHPSVMTKVADYFHTGKKRKLFTGEVTRFLPESSEGAKDQLYHVVFEDEDEQDYNDDEYHEAMQRLESKDNQELVLKNEKNTNNSEVLKAVAVEKSAEELAINFNADLVSSGMTNNSLLTSELPTDSTSHELKNKINYEAETVSLPTNNDFAVIADPEVEFESF
jgi:hypothetical protein